MKIAVEGCCHGCLDAIYRSLEKKKVELLIICGDFQSVRNTFDLQSMSVPDKYKRMGDFQDYYTGKKLAPVFTVFIGGNHEASNYLHELKYGGFVAPNIYYMGRSSVIWYKGLRIGGLSGVYWKDDFLRLSSNDFDFIHNRSAIRKIYHYRKDDYMKLLLLKKSHDMLMVSHDWPEGIYNYGNVNTLLKKKPFFQADIKKRDLGSPFNMRLLEKIQPKYWFSAHLHVRFTAERKWEEGPKVDSAKMDDANNKREILVQNEANGSKKVCVSKGQSSDEILLDMSMSDSETEQPEPKPLGNIEESQPQDEVQQHNGGEHIFKPGSQDTLKINTDLISQNREEIDLSMELISSDSDCDIEANDEVLKSQDKEGVPLQKTLSVNAEPVASDNSKVRKTSAHNKVLSTQFLALDKCLPKRQYLEIMNVPLTDETHPSNKKKNSSLYLDHEYIAAFRVIEKYKTKLDEFKFHQLMNPTDDILDEFDAVKQFYIKEYEKLDEREYNTLFGVSKKAFIKTASTSENKYREYQNPQTQKFISKFLK